MMGRKKFGEVLVRDAEKMKLKNSALGARCVCVRVFVHACMHACVRVQYTVLPDTPLTRCAVQPGSTSAISLGEAT